MSSEFPNNSSPHSRATNDASCVILSSEETDETTVTFSYEIEYRGKKIRCRSAADAERLLERLERGKLSKDDTPWTTDEFQRFTGRIQYQQRRLLAKLLDYGTTAWLEDRKLWSDLDISGNRVLAGTLSGISKVALMLDIDPRRVYTQKTVYEHAKPRRLYQVTSGFLQAAAKHKWPSAEDLRKPKQAGE
jgi:hypothetical protein